MKTKAVSLLFVMVLVLSACGGNGSELQKNREKWEAQIIDHYRYTVVVTCFCMFAGAEVTYEVQNGQVVNQTIQPHPDRQIDPAEIVSFYEQYNTLDKVFDFVEQVNKEADEVTLEYDSNYSFPTEISVDYIKEAIDDEIYISISNLEPLS